MTPADYEISTDAGRLDHAWVAVELMDSYWGKWLKPDQISAAIGASLCFGLYRKRGSWITAQIGFARVVTDGAIFSSVMDVVIDKRFRRQGYGSVLMEAVVAHPKVSPTICILSTRGAGAFYERFGFARGPDVMLRNPT